MNHRLRVTVFAVGAAGLALLFAVGMAGMPEFGGDVHPYAGRALSAAAHRATANVVSSVNFDQRAFDTIGEELILGAAALGAVVLLRIVRAEREDEEGEYSHGPADVFDALRITGYLLLPVMLITGVYIVAHGHLSPGGGFQGGVVLGAAIHMIYLAGDYPALPRGCGPSRSSRPVRR